MNTSNDVLHDDDQMFLRCKLIIVFGTLSAITCSLSTYIYFKYKQLLRSPTLESLVFSFMVAIPGSVTMVISAILRLCGVSAREYCDLSAFLMQQLNLPEILQEGVFFATIAWSLMRWKVTYSGVRRCFAAVLFYGFLAFVVPATTLPKFATTDSVFGSVHQPWCWLPDSDQPGHTASKLLHAYLFIFAFFAASFGVVSGLVCFGIILFNRIVRKAPIHSAIWWRLGYSLVFAISYGLSAIPRIFIPTKGNNTVINAIETFSSCVISGLPFINAVLFLWMEEVWTTVKTHRCHAREAYAQIASGCSQHFASSSQQLDDDIDDNNNLEERGLVDLLQGGGNEEFLLRAQSSTYSNSMGHFSSENPASNPGSCKTSPRGKRKARGIDEAIGAFTATTDVVVATHSTSMIDDDGNHYETRYDPDLQEWIVVKHNCGSGEVQIKKLTNVTSPNLPKVPISVVLSFIGGYCDAVGFCVVDLFTAHVTGNVVLIGVHMANSQKIEMRAIVGKILAIPVFMISVGVAYWLGKVCPRYHRKLLFCLQALLFTASFICAWLTGPFERMNNSSSAQTMQNGAIANNGTATPGAWTSGLLMVAGMAMQHCYQRVHLPGLPLTTFVTGNTNTIVYDGIELWRNWLREMQKKKTKVAQQRRQDDFNINNDDDGIESQRGSSSLTKNATSMAPSESINALRRRWRNNVMCVLSFFLGTVAASAYARFWQRFSFVMPPVLVIGVLLMFWKETSVVSDDDEEDEKDR